LFQAAMIRSSLRWSERFSWWPLRAFSCDRGKSRALHRRGAGPLRPAPSLCLLVLRTVGLPLATWMIRDVSVVIIAIRSDIEHANDVRQWGMFWSPLFVGLVVINTGPASAAVNLLAATILALDQPERLIETPANVFHFIQAGEELSGAHTFRLRRHGKSRQHGYG